MLLLMLTIVMMIVIDDGGDDVRDYDFGDGGVDADDDSGDDD